MGQGVLPLALFVGEIKRRAALAARQSSDQQDESSSFLKKRTKKLLIIGPDLGAAPSQVEKFFGSFFQKRTAFLPLMHIRKMIRLHDPHTRNGAL
jgi:hypothetical protein